MPDPSTSERVFVCFRDCCVLYIPPQGNNNNKLALNEMYEAIIKQKTGSIRKLLLLLPLIFNSALLRHVMPNFCQRISFTTRG